MTKEPRTRQSIPHPALAYPLVRRNAYQGSRGTPWGIMGDLADVQLEAS